MKKSNLVVTIMLVIASSMAMAQSEPQLAPTDNSMADDILADLPPEDPADVPPATSKAAKTPTQKSSMAPAPMSEPNASTPPASDTVQIGTPEAPIDLTPAKNDAFDRLDALKMTRQELIAFMKSGGMKSRLIKEQK